MLTLVATFVAVITLCLAGVQVATLVNQGASAWSIVFAASAVLTAIVCIGVLDWARNLQAGQPRRSARGMDNADDPAESLGFAPSSADEERLMGVLHALEALGNDEVSTEKALQESIDLVSEYCEAASVSVWGLDVSGAATPLGEQANGRTLVGEDAVTEQLDATAAEELFRHRKAMETVGELTTSFLIPLNRGNRCTGIAKVVVETAGTPEERNDDAQRLLRDLSQLCHHLARTVAAPDEYQQAVTDPVTELYSRRHFVSELAAYASISRRYGESLCLLLVDVDNFSACNRAHGSATGDRVLHNVASLVHDTVREADSAYRYDADTIAVVLPATDAENGRAVAERLREGIRTNRTLCEDGGSIVSTVSIGVAEFDEDMRGILPLMSEAEQALEAAKSRGGDRVEVAGGREDGEPSAM